MSIGKGKKFLLVYRWRGKMKYTEKCNEENHHSQPEKPEGRQAARF